MKLNITTDTQEPREQLAFLSCLLEARALDPRELAQLSEQLKSTIDWFGEGISTQEALGFTDRAARELSSEPVVSVKLSEAQLELLDRIRERLAGVERGDLLLALAMLVLAMKLEDPSSECLGAIHSFCRLRHIPDFDVESLLKYDLPGRPAPMAVIEGGGAESDVRSDLENPAAPKR